jgi:hypothetical protein
MSIRELRDLVEFTAPTENVISFEARGSTPAEAEKLASDLADSQVAYLEQAASSLSVSQRQALSDRETTLEENLDTVATEITQARRRLRDEAAGPTDRRNDEITLARLIAEQADLVLALDQVKDDLAGTESSVAAATTIQRSSPAHRPGVNFRMATFAVLGVALAMLLVAVVLLVWSRKDERLRFRDDIADAIGSRVVASTSGQSPRSVARWVSLLADHTPNSVDSWAFRQALNLMAPSADSDTPDAMTVVSIADDTPSLSVGPRIASYCASTGIRTKLVASKGHEQASALWAACSQVATGTEIRPGLVVDTRLGEKNDVDAAVVLAVVDRKEPDLRGLPDTAVTILAVSSGTATAEDLARLAVAADDAGKRIEWLIVVNPDDLDKTTGRFLERERLQHAGLPTRLTGVKSPVLEVVKNTPGRKGAG